MNYRKIYESHFGPIPKELTGRSYDIHHLDGDHSNISPDNLRAVTIQEHYDIHYEQKDWYACYMIAGKMKKTPEEISHLASLSNYSRVEKGTHPFLGGKIQGESGRKRVADGTHNFLGSEHALKRVADGTHPLLDRAKARVRNLKRSAEGTNPFLDPEVARKNVRNQLAAGTHSSQKVWKCEHCGKEGRGAGMFTRYHGGACKAAPK